jgi:hypothetical protein
MKPKTRPRQCITTFKVAGPCKGCGTYLDHGVHLPITSLGLWCNHCCPSCAPTPAGERRAIEVRLRETTKQDQRSDLTCGQSASSSKSRHKRESKPEADKGRGDQNFPSEGQEPSAPTISMRAHRRVSFGGMSRE